MRGAVKTFLFDRAHWLPPGENKRYKGARGPHKDWRSMSDAQSPAGQRYATARAPIVQAIHALQKGAVAACIDAVSRITTQMASLIPGPAAQIPSLDPGPKLMQPVPACFINNSPVDFAGLPADVQRTLDEASLLAQGALSRQTVSASTADWANDMAAEDPEGERFLPIGDEPAAEIPGVRAGDIAVEQVAYRHLNPDQGCTTSALLYVYASLMLLSAPFHDAMRAALGGFGEYKAAPMKGLQRGNAKTSTTTGDYNEAGYHAVKARYLFDVLRCSLIVDDHAALGEAYAALARLFTVVKCKNRLAELPRDVLVVVEFEGWLVEVQFHFRSVLALKVREPRRARAPGGVIAVVWCGWVGLVAQAVDTDTRAHARTGSRGVVP